MPRNKLPFTPSDKSPIPNLKELQKLRERTDALKAIDWAKLRTTLDHPDPEVRREIANEVVAIRGDLTAALEGLDYTVSNNKEGYRNLIKYDTPEVLATSSLTYEELRAFLESEKIKLPVPKNIMRRWKKAKERENRWSVTWFDKSRFGESRLKVPEDPWEVYLELSEMELRRLPDYGKEFSLDRSRIVFEGDPTKLAYALQNGLMDEIIIKAYPWNVGPEEMEKLESDWIIEQLDKYYPEGFKRTHSYYGDCSVSTTLKKMHEVTGKHRLHFVCSFKPNSPVRNPKLSMDEQVQQLGRYPDVVEALFYIHHMILDGKMPAELMLHFDKGAVPYKLKRDTFIGKLSDKMQIDVSFPITFYSFYSLKDKEKVPFII